MLSFALFGLAWLQMRLDFWPMRLLCVKGRCLPASEECDYSAMWTMASRTCAVRPEDPIRLNLFHAGGLGVRKAQGIPGSSVNFRTPKRLYGMTSLDERIGVILELVNRGWPRTHATYYQMA